MASERAQNIMRLFSNTRTRLILVTTIFLLTILIIAGYLGFHRRTEGAGADAALSRAPQMQSIPGQLEPSAQYAELQERENLQKAQQATQTGGSAIPTLIRAQKVQIGDNVTEAGGVGFKTLSQSDRQDGSQKQLNFGNANDGGLGLGNNLDAFSRLLLSGTDPAGAGGAGTLGMLGNGYGLSTLLTNSTSGGNGQGNNGLGNNGFGSNGLGNNGLGNNGFGNNGFGSNGVGNNGVGNNGLGNNGLGNNGLGNNGLGNNGVGNNGLGNNGLGNNGLGNNGLGNNGLGNNGLGNNGLGNNSFGNSGLGNNSLGNSGLNNNLAGAGSLGNNQSDFDEMIKEQNRRLTQQERQQKLREIQGNMQSQAQQMFTSWVITKQIYVPGTPDKDKTTTKEGGLSAYDPNNPDNMNAANKAPLVKAGDIQFAILDTQINSDEPGPILATITQGKYKGAKLLGTLLRQDDRVLLSFQTMSLPSFQSSTSISAVAVDPQTARTALASDVNYHYFLRYGSLFASSFMEGFGKSVASSGTQVQTGDTFTLQTAARTAQQNTQVGLGMVGQKWGEIASQNFEKYQPTVEVYAGTGLGILFLSDVKPPQS